MARCVGCLFRWSCRLQVKTCRKVLGNLVEYANDTVRQALIMSSKETERALSHIGKVLKAAIPIPQVGLHSPQGDLADHTST